MLVQFKFSNYKCFKDETVLNLTTSQKKNKEFYSIDTRFGYRVLRSLAVYGANASGKSKLFKAFDFLKTLLTNAKDKDGEYIWKKEYDRFRLSTETKDKSSNFEIIFIIDDIQYRYGLELTKEQIYSEYLYIQEDEVEIEVFLRSSNKIIGKERLGKIGETLIERDMIKKDMPFLSALNEWNDEMAQKIFLWLKKAIVISGNKLPQIPARFINDNETKEFLIKFLNLFDIGIRNISMHEISIDSLPEDIKRIIGEDNLEGKKVYDGLSSSHNIYDEHYSIVESCPFHMETDESLGTNRLLRLSIPLFFSSVVLIDEFDSSIHPNILKVLVCLFYRLNELNKQLIFTTHNSSLLSRKIDEELLPNDEVVPANDMDIDALLANDNISFKHSKTKKQKLFIKDQIYFVTKNRYGVSSLVPLTDFKNLKSDLEQLYLEGLLDGTPNIKYYEMSTLLSKENN